MKSHKYWSLGALFCMLGCIYSGIRKSMTAHKYFAYSSLLCMGMSIYSGHKLVLVVFIIPAPASIPTISEEKRSLLASSSLIDWIVTY